MYKKLSILLLFLSVQIFSVFPMEDVQVVPADYDCLDSLEGLANSLYSFSPDCGSLFIIISNFVYALDIVSEELVPVLETSKPFYFTSLALSCDGNRLAYGVSDGQVGIWDLVANELLHKFKNRGGGKIISMRFGPDGKFLFTLSSCFDVRIWLLNEDTITKTLEGRTMAKEFCKGLSSFSPDVQFVAILQSWYGDNSEIYLSMWDVNSGKLRWTVRCDDYMDLPCSVAFSSDGARIFVGSSLGKIFTFNASSGDFIQILEKKIDRFIFLKAGSDDMYIIVNDATNDFVSGYFVNYSKVFLRNTKLVFTSALHPGLGEESPASVLPQEIVKEILDYI